MAINRYFQPTRYQGDFYTPPIELLGEVLQQAQKEYNDNYALASQIKNKYINALAPDRATANTIQSEWEGRIDNIVQKYSGDYSQATKDLNVLLSDMQKEYGPGGRAHAIEYNYKTWTDHWRNVQEGVQKKVYTAQQASALQSQFYSQYKGIGTKDPMTGAYTQANPTVLQPYVDEQEIIQKVIEKVPKRSGKTVVPVPDGQGRIIMRTQEYDYIDPNDMNSAVSQTLLNNDAWVNYNKQLAEMQGEDPRTYVASAIQNLVQNVTPLYSGILRQVNDVKIDYDQIAMENLRHSHALARQREQDANSMKRMLLKHALDNPTDSGEDLVRIGTRTSATAFQPIDKTEGLTSGSKFLWPWSDPSKDKYQKLSLDQVLSNPKAYSDRYNVPLLSAAKEAAEIWRDENGNPARDKQALAFDIYNANLKESVGSGVFMRRFGDPKQMTREAQRALPQIQAATTTIHEFNLDTGTSQPITDVDKRKKIYGELYDTETNKPRQYALGRTSVQTGVPFGLVFAKEDGSGYYIIEEAHEDIKRMNQKGGIFERAFGFINTPTRTQGGEPFDFIDNNKALTAFGKIDYVVNPDNPEVIIPPIHYYDPDLYATDPQAALYRVPVTDADGNVIRKRVMTAADMEQKIFPSEAQKLYEVRGATKADVTRFPDYLEE